MKKLLFICSVILFLSNCNTSKKTTTNTNTEPSPTENTSGKAMNFIENTSVNLSAILAQAKAKHKIVFVDVYATWCAPCKLMDKEVFTNQATADAFNANFINYKVNVEKNNGPTIKLLYNIEVLPTLLFLDGDGNVLEKAENSLSISQLNELMKSALKKVK